MDNVTNNNYGTMRDINNIDKSINITNIYNMRINLEDRAKTGKIYEYTMFCLHKYKKAKNLPKGIIRVTCINVHSDNMFVSDHIHIDFPESKYDELSFNYSIMKVKAKAYKYPKGKSYDYGLLVTKIESANNRIGHYEGMYGTKNLPVIKSDKEKDQREFFKYLYMKEFSQERLCEILNKQISYLEGNIAKTNNLYSGFIFDMIATYYFANEYKHDLETKSLYISNLSKSIIIELITVMSKLLFKLNNGEIFMWRHLLIELNELCNVLQDINKDITKKNRNNEDEFNDVDESIQTFAIKIKSMSENKMFDKIKRRNEDFGYQYPKNVDKYKEQLHDYVIWYMLNQRDLKLDQYDEDWREILNVSEI